MAADTTAFATSALAATDLGDDGLGLVGVLATLSEIPVAILLRSLTGGVLGGLCLFQGGIGAVLVDELGPFDEGVDHLVLGNDHDVLALHEQVAALVARSNAEIGIAGLSRPVDNTCLLYTSPSPRD